MKELKFKWTKETLADLKECNFGNVGVEEELIKMASEEIKSWKLQMVNLHKIFKDYENNWYFFGLTWSDLRGPYKSERKVKRKLKKFLKRNNNEV